MSYRYPQTIDLTPAGEFLQRPAALTWTAKIGIAATLVAFGAGFLAVAALFLWIASLLLPVALVAGVVAYTAYRVQLRRVRHG